MISVELFGFQVNLSCLLKRFMYFSLLLQRKDTKRKQPEKPFLRERFLETFPKRGRGIRAQEGANASPRSTILERSPLVVRSQSARSGVAFVFEV